MINLEADMPSRMSFTVTTRVAMAYLRGTASAQPGWVRSIASPGWGLNYNSANRHISHVDATFVKRSGPRRQILISRRKGVPHRSSLQPSGRH
jgi:hypothetical protein